MLKICLDIVARSPRETLMVILNRELIWSQNVFQFIEVERVDPQKKAIEAATS